MSKDVELPLLSLAKYEAKLPGLEFGVRIMQAAALHMSIATCRASADGGQLCGATSSKAPCCPFLLFAF